MGDYAVDDNDNATTAGQGIVEASSIDTAIGDTTENRPRIGREIARMRGRRRPERIGEEIELYCNPFVEVWGRLSMFLRRITRRWVEKLVGMMLEVQENVVWRGILYVVDHTAW